MPSIALPGDDERGLADLIRNLQRRIGTLETQVRLQNATVDAPGRFMYRDSNGVVRFSLGGFPSGAIGTQQYDAAGNPIAAAEQSYNNTPRTISAVTYDPGTPAVAVTATAGPSGQILVILSARIYQAATGTGSGFLAVSGTGGKVFAASDADSLEYADRAAAGARPHRASRTVLLNSVSPTTPTVLTCQFRVSDAAHAYVFDDVRIQAIPL